MHKFHPWPPVTYIPLYIDISHIVLVCFMSSLLCAYSATDHVHDNSISCLNVIFLALSPILALGNDGNALARSFLLVSTSHGQGPLLFNDAASVAKKRL
jgi:hypothetical protein